MLARRFSALALLLVFSTAGLHAEEAVETAESAKLVEKHNRNFDRNYLHFGVSRSYPLSRAQEFLYQREPMDPHISYRFASRSSMLLGLGVGVKTLYMNEDGDSLRLYHMTQEGYYSIRLYHPLYLDLGGTLIYFIPATFRTNGFRRKEPFHQELGVSARAQLTLKLSGGMLCVHVDRMRGTATNHYHFMEVGAGYSYSLQ